MGYYKHPTEVELLAKDRIDNDKCFICGKELKPQYENNLSKNDAENWKRVNHSEYGQVKVHAYHCNT